MKTTVILKDFTDDFYNGVGESIKGLSYGSFAFEV